MIRKRHVSDLPQIKTIWLETNLTAHDFVDKDYWYEQLDSLEAALLASDVFVYEDKQILGFIGLRDDFVEGLFIKEGFQSQGVGKALLDHAKEGKKSLALTVYQRNWRAWRFYLREGFVIQTMGFDEFNGEPDYFMIWS